MLDKQRLIDDLRAVGDKVKDIEDPETATLVYAIEMANAIEKFIKSGSVGFTPGQIQGTCPSGGGPLTLGSANNGKIE